MELTSYKCEISQISAKKSISNHSRKKSLWKSRLNKLCDGALSSSSNADFTRHSTDGEENACIGQISNCQLNTSLSAFYQSLNNCIFSECFVSGWQSFSFVLFINVSKLLAFCLLSLSPGVVSLAISC